ncbi:hypothetical protein PhCBS80983_g05654 [Powellomyces hirtus]|uniref:ubiquitinyl hydrolase 1 n=1 Tax=Powellomyces hirtus TaxID=109895 RepID=A0A507DVP5_9FUNG|nr:hypothetical protein PhCBS80983_g05654 [Powellomyces hirtus]
MFSFRSYCNSVVQALYFCRPFRECVQAYSYPTSPALLTAATENISLPFPTPPLKTASSSMSSISGYFVPDRSGKDSKASNNNAVNNSSTISEKENGKLDRKRKDSALKTSPAINKALLAATSIPAILERMQLSESENDTLLSALSALFTGISSQKKKTGVMGPRQFVITLKRENELFRNTMHQDAHEMLNYTLNAIAEILLRHKKEMAEKFKTLPQFNLLMPNGNGRPPHTNEPNSPRHPQKPPNVTDAPATITPPASWVHALFQGILTNETKCLTCETVTSRDETFLDLSVDVEPNCSLSYCLRNFSKSETLCQKNKFFCDTCHSLQEAEKRMIVRKVPNILAVHLKRFKYQEQLQRFTKLSYRVPFPFELRLSHFTDDAEDPERLYHLFAVIVHIGSGPHHGHYVTLVKSHNQWLLFDDDDVSSVDESELHKYYGDNHAVGCGYIFFYAAENFDANELVQSLQYPNDDFHSSRTSQDPPPSNNAPTTTDNSSNLTPSDALNQQQQHPSSSSATTTVGAMDILPKFFQPPSSSSSSISLNPPPASDLPLNQLHENHHISPPQPSHQQQHQHPPLPSLPPLPPPPLSVTATAAIKKKLGKRASFANVLHETLGVSTLHSSSSNNTPTATPTLASNADSGAGPGAYETPPSGWNPDAGVLLEDEKKDGSWGWFGMGKRDKEKDRDRDKK